MGERPTHPELLDYLASDFVANGWSIKKLHRKILLSNTYGESTGVNPEAMRITSFYLTFNLKHRLDMETLCDSVLAVSGQLDGPSEERRSRSPRTISGARCI